jgi:acetyltransferase-like isoleucine patch superfamily enzyme
VHAGSKIVANGGHVRIGAGSLVNMGCNIIATGSITIGDHALIAEHVTIRDQDHAFADTGVPYRVQERLTDPITIGDNVWLGAKVTVTRGVTIPPNTIVGANSVVTKSLTGGRIFVGAPALALR